MRYVCCACSGGSDIVWKETSRNRNFSSSRSFLLLLRVHFYFLLIAFLAFVVFVLAFVYVYVFVFDNDHVFVVFFLFTALHTMEGGIIHGPSVCPSVKCANCYKRKETYASILMRWKIYSSDFQTRITVARRWPLLSEILDQTDPRSFINADFQSVFARSSSAVTHSEKVQLWPSTNEEADYALSNEPTVNILRCP